MKAIKRTNAIERKVNKEQKGLQELALINQIPMTITVQHMAGYI